MGFRGVRLIIGITSFILFLGGAVAMAKTTTKTGILIVDIQGDFTKF